LELESQGSCQPLRNAFCPTKRLILLYNAIDRGTTGDATTLIYCIQRDVFAQ